MQLHQLKPKHKKKEKKRVGRGGKRGTYSGRGMKGQKSRAGRTSRPLIRELIKRYPKLRGYRFRSKGPSVRVVNVKDLQKEFKPNQKITPKVLIEKGLIRRIKGRVPQVKILGKGPIDKPLTVEGCKLSQTAKEKIEKAGGKIKT